MGDSVDLIAAHSDTNAGTSPIVGGYLLAFSGKGNVYGAHYNRNLPRNGDYTSKFVAGLDYRAYFNNCRINGEAICGASGTDLTVHPVSVTYNGTLAKPTYVVDYSASFAHNLPGGVHGSSGDFEAARGVGTQANYTVLRFNGSLTGVLPQEWQYRIAGNLQYTRDSLVTYEGIGLVGANSVRGFLEREVANDEGIFLNFEVYTPELAPKLNIKDGSFRLLGFIDRGEGWKVPLPTETSVHDSVGSVGAGLRYVPGKIMTVKFDLARVTDAVGSTNTKTGDYRGQIAVMVNW
jgi:hemolysin activation/secretion protein